MIRVLSLAPALHLFSLPRIPVAKGRGRFRSRALKEPLGPAFHQNNLNYNGYNKNGADYADGVIVHGPLPVYFS